MISDARGGHVSPGIYTEEKDVTYSVKSLGITSLGLVGETLYGPAFEDIEVKDWSEFVDYFGGTSPELFKGTGLPKYELPYVAKSYLEESKNLHVVKVLGLSGYDAGPAFVIKQGEKPIVILRSKMVYSYNGGNICEAGEPDQCIQVATKITVGPYKGKEYNSVCAGSSGTTGDSGKTDVSKFSLTVTCTENLGFQAQYIYNVSLNSNDTEYIYKVLSSSPDTGSTPIYIDAIYENEFVDSDSNGQALTGATEVDSGTINSVFHYMVLNSTIPSGETKYTWTLKRVNPNVLTNANKDLGWLSSLMVPAPQGETMPNENVTISGQTYSAQEKGFFRVSLKVKIPNAYSDYKEMYRPGQTPWVVSDIVADSDSKTAKMRKLFKFITISDGNASNYQVKISIANINVNSG